MVDVIFYFFFFFTAYKFLAYIKGTPFELNPSSRVYVGSYWLLSVYLLVFVGVFSFYTWGEDATHQFNLTNNSITGASFFAIYGLLVFAATVKVSFFISSELGFYNYRNKIKDESRQPMYVNSILVLICILIFIVSALFFALGSKHALLSSILSGQELSSVRFHNTYGSSVPSVLQSFVRFLYLLLAIFLGVNKKHVKRKVYFISLSALAFITTFHGSKEPVVIVFIVYLISSASLTKSLNLRLLVKLTVVFGVVASLLYFLLLQQFDSFRLLPYLEGRLIYAQIHGFYEQYSLRLTEFDYIYNSIPFANFLVDYPIFSKDLMMATWGQNLVSSADTGVMNSLFMGEALAIGGLPLMVLSPFIVGFSYSSLFILIYYCGKGALLLSSQASTIVSGTYVIGAISLTGDLAGFIFFKWHIMHVFFFLPIWVAIKTFRNIQR